MDADILGAFYAECADAGITVPGRPIVQHRTAVEHRCDHRCGRHRFRPLGATTIRHMHVILSGALTLSSPQTLTVSLGCADGSTYPRPGTLTQRYNRLVERLGIENRAGELT